MTRNVLGLDSSKLQVRNNKQISSILSTKPQHVSEVTGVVHICWNIRIAISYVDGQTVAIYYKINLSIFFEITNQRGKLLPEEL